MNIKKKDWISNFTLVGELKLGDYSYKLDEVSENNPDYVYNSLNLGVDCGEKHGTVFCEMFGGYNSKKDNIIYAHGKKEDGKDDWENSITVDWDDRNNDDILDEIGDSCFITVGLEKTEKGKTYYKQFLSAYDAIKYINETAESGMVVNVKGKLQFSQYKDTVQVRKNITSIVLSKVEKVADYKAVFTQTVLLDKDSVDKKNIDKDKGVLYLDTTVLDYVSKIGNTEVKSQYPFHYTFDFAMNFEDEKKCKLIMDKVLKVKKDYTQITFEGEFVESGATVEVTMDDVPDDIKELIEAGIYTEEQALERCSANGNRERRMILMRPVIRLIGEDKIPTIQKFEERYTEEDLTVDVSFEDETADDVNDSDDTDDDDDDDFNIEDLFD